MSGDYESIRDKAKFEQFQHEIEELRTQNEAYLKTISYLSNEVIQLRKRNSCVTISNLSANEKKKKVTCSVSTQCALLRSCPSDSSLIAAHDHLIKQQTKEMVTDNEAKCLPLEVLMYIFRNLSREDLDKCELVCKKWHDLINEQSVKLAPRVVCCLKMIEKSYLSLTVSTKNVSKKYSYTINDHERTEVVFDCLRRLLKNTRIKRMILCNLNITDEFCRRLHNCFKNIQLTEIFRVEMLAVNLSSISPDQFHKLLGQVIIASQYFLDGVRNAMEDHFSANLFEQPAICKADDFTVYDVRALDQEDVLLAVGDDALLSLIFGSPALPQRNTLYLDSPDISPTFLKTCLSQFVECDDVDHMIAHVEFAHCHEQQIPTLKDIILEYEHDIQVEWSAKNKKTSRVMEARVSRNGDGDNFCHLTLSIQPE